MAKILIVYDSKTGNTEKMAYAVAEGARQVNGIEVIVKKADQTSLNDLLAADKQALTICWQQTAS